MDLIDEEHVIGLKRGKKPSQVSRLVQHRTRGDLDTDTEFGSDDVG